MLAVLSLSILIACMPMEVEDTFEIKSHKSQRDNLVLSTGYFSQGGDRRFKVAAASGSELSISLNDHILKGD
jgi:hypothetical protein